MFCFDGKYLIVKLVVVGIYKLEELIKEVILGNVLIYKVEEGS